MTRAIPFDTLEYAKKLMAAGFTEKQAEVQTEALAGILEDHIVTRQYLDLKLHEIKADMIKWVAGLLLAQGALIAALIKLL